jgi:curved DNA-binding protein
MEDYYSILGLDENADQDQIKSAYRKLAKQHHPDLNPGNAEAENLFKQVNEANDVLSDPQRRAQYDQQRKFGSGNPFAQHMGGDPFHQSFHFNFGPNGFEDIINQFFNNPFARQQAARNRDFQFTLNITLEEAFQGKTMPISFEANGQSKNITVSIPAGVAHNTKLRFQGHGDRSQGNLPPGDLYVIVMINEHALFRRDGPHLHMNASIDAIAAIIGHELKIKTIDGVQLSTKLPPGTQHGAVMRLQGHGMPSHNNARQRGDLYINVSITVPRNLTPAQLATLETLQSERA